MHGQDAPPPLRPPLVEISHSCIGMVSLTQQKRPVLRRKRGARYAAPRNPPLYHPLGKNCQVTTGKSEILRKSWRDMECLGAY